MSDNIVYLEPFKLRSGHTFDVEYHQQYLPKIPERAIKHFHDSHEIIIFEDVDGTVRYNNSEFKLQPHDIIFTPALMPHQLDIMEKSSFYVVELIPEVLSSIGSNSVTRFFSGCFHIRPSSDDYIELHQVTDLMYRKCKENPLSKKGLALLHFLLISISEQKRGASVEIANLDQDITKSQTLESILNLVHSNKTADLTMKEAAEACNLSPSYFSRVFKEIFNCNYSEYTNRNRLYLGARLLSHSEKSITEISGELGFANTSHFTAKFKEMFNTTPKQYRDGATAQRQA